MPKTWRLYQRPGDLAKDMATMPKVWRSHVPKAWRTCQRHGDYAKGMESMPKAWRPCQMYGDHAVGMEIVQMKESGMRLDDKLYCRIAYHEQDSQYSV